MVCVHVTIELTIRAFAVVQARVDELYDQYAGLQSVTLLRSVNVSPELLFL